MGNKKKTRESWATSPLTEYEQSYVCRCKRNKIRWEYNTDGSPVSRPRGKVKRTWFFFAPWNNGEDSIVIMPKTVGRKNSLLNKINKRDLKYHVWAEGETDIILLFDSKNLKKWTDLLWTTKGTRKHKGKSRLKPKK